MKKDHYLPLVSIITVNWNSATVTGDLLHSIIVSNTYPNLEIIVIDNNSDADPTEYLRTIFPSVKIIRNSQNYGFAAANNIGMSIANGDYFFLVNNDTEFTPQLIEGLLEMFIIHSDAGIVCPKFQYFFQKGIIEYAGYSNMSIFTGRNKMLGCREKDEGQYDFISETNFAHGGAMMVSRTVVENVGMMPEDFFLYYEEFEWSNKVKKAGYKIFVQPKSLIYHKESMTTGKSSPLKTFYLTRNRLLFMKRNMPIMSFTVFILYFTFFTTPKNTALFLLKGKKEHLLSFWKGIMWHFNHKITFN